MSVIGALAGQDSLVTFVMVGLVLVKKLRLDKIAAMSIFYLSYITGQAAGPTIAIILMAQETAGLPPMSGTGARLIVWAALTLLCVFWTTRYCLKISRDPSKSILGFVEQPDANDTLGKNRSNPGLSRNRDRALHVGSVCHLRLWRGRLRLGLSHFDRLRDGRRDCRGLR